MPRVEFGRLLLLLALAEVHVAQLVGIVEVGGVHVEWMWWSHELVVLRVLLGRAVGVAEPGKELGKEAVVGVLLGLLVLRVDLRSERVAIETAAIVVVVWIVAALKDQN